MLRCAVICALTSAWGLSRPLYAVLYFCGVVCALNSGWGLRRLLYAVLYICAVISAQICSPRA